ncbi:MAG: acyl-CoA carboxylase subunit epsilon [Mycobacterium sp.]
MRHEDITEVSDPHQLTIDEPDHSIAEIRIVKGAPTDAEVAAVVTVLAGLGGGSGHHGPQELNLWGHPVDKLRYGFYSWQAVTLRDRTHVRR